MFESTLEAQGLNVGERKFGSLSAAVMAHVGVVAAILVVAALVVPPVKDPPVRLVVSIVDGLKPDRVFEDHAPKPPIKGADTPKPGHAVAPQPVEPNPPPIDTPSDLPKPATEPPVSDVDGTGEGLRGDPTGSSDGVLDGLDGGNGNGTSGGGLPGEPVLVTGDMVKPVLLVKVEPAYPEVARRAGLGGRVRVTAVIGLDGGVESAEVLTSTNPLFDRAALDAVRKWRYRAATMNGQPVRVYFTVVVDFVVR